MNIAALAAAGVNKAWELVADELTAVTLKMGPAADYDPATDTDSPTWSKELTIDVFLYGEELENKEATTADEMNAPSRAFIAKALVRVSDCDNTRPDDRSQIVVTAGGVVWRVTKVEKPPGNAIFILELKR